MVALDALEYWSENLPSDVLTPHYPNILPYLDIYLRTTDQGTLNLLTMIVVIPPTNTVWGVYRNHPVRLSVRPSIRPSMYLVSATPPKRLIGFL